MSIPTNERAPLFDLFVYALGLLPERQPRCRWLDQPEPMFWLTDVAQGLAMETVAGSTWRQKPPGSLPKVSIAFHNDGSAIHQHRASRPNLRLGFDNDREEIDVGQQSHPKFGE